MMQSGPSFRSNTRAGSVTRIDVVLNSDPFSGASIKTLDHIDERLLAIAADPETGWQGSVFDYTGTTAGIRDLTAVNKSDRWLIQQLVVLAVFGVLLVVIRRPIICVFLMASVVFGYLVTLGTTQWLFAMIYGDTFVGLDWKVPIYLFVILTAVGADYNIYLVTRILEEQKTYGPRKGMQVAIVRTGGIISSCGLIMAGSFIAMMTGSLRAMIELGFALSFGIILDTFVIRPMLVPAFFALVQRLNREEPEATEAASQPGEVSSDVAATDTEGVDTVAASHAATSGAGTSDSATSGAGTPERSQTEAAAPEGTIAEDASPAGPKMHGDRIQRTS